MWFHSSLNASFGDFMRIIEVDFKRKATRTVDKSIELCKRKSVIYIVIYHI